MFDQSDIDISLICDFLKVAITFIYHQIQNQKLSESSK